MNELKPCPFCGGKSHLYRTVDYGWCVECEKCKALIGFDSDNDNSCVYSESKLAVKAWNMRTNDWIPVDERLPSKEEYSIKLANGKRTYVNLLVSIKFPKAIETEKGEKIILVDSAFYNGKHWFATAVPDRSLGEYIIAWKPMPEPYIPQFNEK